ncbi:MAG: tetratricopeptide repeat protein [Planctomycetota bacterium]
MRDWFLRELKRAPAAYAALLVLGVSFLAYGNTLDAGFHFDDEHHIVKNPYLRSAEYAEHYWHRPDYFSALPGHHMYRPLVLWTFALNYHWGGYEPLFWRLTAIALHGICAVGVLLTFLVVAGRWEQRPVRARYGGALVAALFFAVHPVFTETVAYASARSSLLAGTCLIWAFLAHQGAAQMRRQGAPRVACWAASLLLFGLALLAKEIAIVFPALLLWCAVLRRRGYGAVIPSIALALLYLYVRQLTLGTAVVDFSARAEAMATADAGSGGARPIAWNLFTQARVVTAYLCLLGWPFGLCVDRHVRVSQTLFEPGVIAGGLIILGLLVTAWRVRRERPLVSLGIVWFLVALAPTSSILPLNQVMNEHRLYLPGLGVALAVAGWVRPWLTRRTARCGVIVATGLLAMLTWRRNEDWSDPVRLWESAVRVSPDSDRAWNALGVALRRRGDHEGARWALTRAFLLAPEAWSPSFNLGTLHLQHGRQAGDDEEIAEAKDWLEVSLMNRPGSERSRWYLAETLHAQGRVEQAESAFRNLAGLSPQLFELTRYPLARIALERGRFDRSERLYREALREGRDPVAAHLGLAEVALRRQQRPTAVREARDAMKARPHSPHPHVFLARLHQGTPLAMRHLFEAERRGYRPTPAERRSILNRKRS